MGASPSVSATDAASLTVLVPLTASTTSQLSFATVTTTALPGAVTVPAPAPSAAVMVNATVRGNPSPQILNLKGAAGQVYHLSVPTTVTTSSGRLTVSALTLSSANSGNITKTQTGVLDARGSDTVRIGGALAVPAGTRATAFSANVPTALAYP